MSDGALPSPAWLVVVPLPIPAYAFAPPHGHGGPAPVGARVLVPWQGKLQVGVVVGADDASGHRLREVVAVLDGGRPWVNAGFVAALQEHAQLARTPLGLLWCDFVGVGWEARVTHRVRAVPDADLSPFGRRVPTAAWTDAGAFDEALLDAIRAQGLLDETFEPRARTVTAYRARDVAHVDVRHRVTGGFAARDAGPGKLTPKQEAAWAWLRAHGPAEGAGAWADSAGVSASVVNAVVERGWAEVVEVPLPPPPAWVWLQAHGPALSQRAWADGAGASVSSIASLLARGWAESVDVPAPPPPLPAPGARGPRPTPDDLPEAPVWRLHGGRALDRHRRLAARIRRLLGVGRGVLIVGPDHASVRRAWEDLSGLAAETDTRAVLVSGQLNDDAREYTWQLVQSGLARLVIGTHHALSAPLADVALTVVLEEASDAHKLLSGSHAFVPDVAARAARAAGGVLALVGTVPAVESLPVEGVVLPPPRARVHVVDYANPPEQPSMGPLSGVHLKPGDLGYPISHDLARVLRQVAERGRAAALLAPRRGYAALVNCPNCDHTPQCRNCDVPLRFHRERRRLECHQCGYGEPMHDRCEKCGEQLWRTRGPGTEWIAQEVRRLLPDFPIYRFDKEVQDDLTALRAGAPGVVVGTQALLGTEAPADLAVVGVTLADTWLNVSDFRASERYHRLLRQLLVWHPERAPLLVVQTFQAKHPALLSVLDAQSADHYPRQEYGLRQTLKYPPHSVMAQLEITSRDQARADAAARAVAAALLGSGARPEELIGPAPGAVARVKGAYPYQLLLRAGSEARLAELLGRLERPSGARFRVDVNPRGGL